MDAWSISLQFRAGGSVAPPGPATALGGDSILWGLCLLSEQNGAMVILVTEGY